MTAIAVAPNSTTPAAHRPLFFGPRVDIPAPAAQSLSIDDVCDLLDAAGPLTVRDIAGGLAVPVRHAAACVRQMARESCARRDEFGRYRLSGSCAMR